MEYVVCTNGEALDVNLERVRKPSPGVLLGRAEALREGSGTTLFEFAYTL